MMQKRELCFIYNAQSGVKHAFIDYVHKIVSPDTYQCSLCSVTYGNLGMHRQWADYLRALPFKTRFFYQDTLPADLERAELPAVFVVMDGHWEKVIDHEEMNAAKTLVDLISLCDKKLSAYIET